MQVSHTDTRMSRRRLTITTYHRFCSSGVGSIGEVHDALLFADFSESTLPEGWAVSTYSCTPLRHRGSGEAPHEIMSGSLHRL